MRVVVVGAGLSGLVAARELQAAGIEVRVVDKGRAPGGRLATRRIGRATVDHGAQFFTVRTPAFQHRVDDWMDRGLVSVWSNGFRSDDGNPRYTARGGMNSLAKDLATGIDVSCSTMAFAIRRDDPWTVVIDDGSTLRADGVIVTTPLPQAFALLADAEVALDDELMRTDYDRTIALLATLDGPPAIAPPGALQAPTDEVAFVADNAAKGVSSVPAVTLHASARWSETHWEEPSELLLTSLRALIAPWLGSATILEAQIKKWRFAAPRTSWHDPCWVSADGGIVLAGDAFDGPRVEAAHNSGLAAGHVFAD